MITENGKAAAEEPTAALSNCECECEENMKCNRTTIIVHHRP